MKRRMVRLVFAMLVAVLLFGRKLPSPRAAEVRPAFTLPPVSARIFPSERSYLVDDRVVIDAWPTAHGFFARHGGHMRQAFAEPLYIDPLFEAWMRRMRPTILESAARHNHQSLTGMDDAQFATVVAAILYLENNSALNDRSSIGRAVTPLYENLQASINELGVGANFSMRPSNLRPSIAIDILSGKVPLPPNLDDNATIYRPLTVHGSALQERMRSHPLVEGWTPPVSEAAAELLDDRLAIEYLATNLEIAQYRSDYEWVPISWISLGTWHNQGIVAPSSILRNPLASLYIARLERYLPSAAQLIYAPAAAPFAPGGQPIAR